MRFLDRASVRADIGASIVVFLVALPLSLGIAIASGAPPIAGLLSAVVGGIIVGALSGSPLQVSGPAAGLAVIVLDFTQRFGWQQTCVITAIAGLFQIAGGVARVGHYARAFSMPLIKGMLAGIGVLITLSQLHILFGHKPLGGGVANLLGLPAAVAEANVLALALGVISLAAIIVWPLVASARLRAIPAPLVGVLAGTAVAIGASALAHSGAATLPRVHLPEGGLLGAVAFLDLSGVASWPALLGAALALALVASLESLLTAAAADRMQTHAPRSNFDRELVAQGVGNAVAGAIGGMPITGVIVRTGANIFAGARTQLSAILHGGWVLLFVVAFPFVLDRIPLAALAAILIFTGFKLANPAEARALYAKRPSDAAVYAVTLTGVVATDLLTGIALGFAAKFIRLSWDVFHIRIEHREIEGRHSISLAGIATFLHLPRIARALERVPLGAPVVLRTDRLAYMDASICEHLETWRKERQSSAASPESAVGARSRTPGLEVAEPEEVAS